MPRIRSIKPEFWRSPSTAKASPRARLLYIAMWGWADDYGVGEWTPRELLGYAFPNDEDLGRTEFQCLCTEVAACFGTQFYVIKGRRFYCIPAWDEHQKNERRAQGKYPRPDDPDACIDAEVHTDTETHGSSVQTVGDTASGTGEQGTGNREQGKRGTGEPARASVEHDFDEAYAHWPKKVERKAALEKYMVAGRKIGWAVVQNAVIAFGDAYAATTEKQFVPALGVWLSKERWTDELPTAARPGTTPTRTDANVAFVSSLYEQQQMEIEQ